MSQRTQTAAPADSQSGTRRRGRGWLVALIVLALLAAGLIFADRYTRMWAQDRAAATLQQKMGTPERPKIDIKDVPFLTSAAANSFNHVTLEAKRLQSTVPIEHLTADIKGLKTSDNYSKGIAREMTGKARVTWEAVAKEAGYDLKYMGDNKVSVNYPLELFGQRITAIVTATPVFERDKQQIALGTPTVNVAGIQLPSDITKQILDMFMKPVVLPMPAGVTATNMTMAEDGVTLEFEGKDVDITNLK